VVRQAESPLPWAPANDEETDMTEYDPSGPRLPALEEPEGRQRPEGEADFAEEHEDTAVDEDIINGEDTEREPESPRGWAGMEDE
jgi:hypothetical protein